MPYGRYPERVKDFNRWSRDKVNGSKLSDSATGNGARGWRRRRTRRKKKRKKED